MHSFLKNATIRKRGRSLSNSSTEEILKSMNNDEHINYTIPLRAINQCKMSMSTKEIQNINSYSSNEVVPSKLSHSFRETTSEDLTMWTNELTVNSNSVLAQPQQRRSSINNKRFHGSKTVQIYTEAISTLVDVLLRIGMFFIFINLERSHAFRRKILPEEMWMLKNPRSPDIISASTLIIAVLLTPFCTTILHWLITRNGRDFRAASWTWTLIVCLNGVITSSLKVIAGRPRPDFFYRCFPDGIQVLSNVTNSNGTVDFFNCTGDPRIINEGYKSFPSGHSSFSFAAFGFITFYIGAKLNAFNAQGRGQNWRLCVAILPLAVATFIAVSRTCDYHHHWQDVSVGGIIGFALSYFIYRQYYPSIFSLNCQRPYYRGNKPIVLDNTTTVDYNAADINECSPLIEKNV